MLYSLPLHIFTFPSSLSTPLLHIFLSYPFYPIFSLYYSFSLSSSPYFSLRQTKLLLFQIKTFVNFCLVSCCILIFIFSQGNAMWHCMCNSIMGNEIECGTSGQQFYDLSWQTLHQLSKQRKRIKILKTNKTLFLNAKFEHPIHKF